MGCFLLCIIGINILLIIAINILLMNNHHTSNNTSLTQNKTNEPDNSKYDLSGRLLAQLLDNNVNYKNPRNYLNFPLDHPGHLNFEKQVKLVDILKSSAIADQYRFGCTVGKFYIKKTQRHPNISADMIGVVLRAESMTT